MKASDVVKKLQSRPPSATSGLATYWKALCFLEFGKQTAQPITRKEKGQLSRLQSICGDETRAVIAYAIGHWVKFAALAGTMAGTMFPTMPHIGFLVKHATVAHEWYRGSLKSQTGVQSSAAVEDDVPAPVPPVPQEPAHILTTDELVQMLAGLKE